MNEQERESKRKKERERERERKIIKVKDVRRKKKNYFPHIGIRKTQLSMHFGRMDLKWYRDPVAVTNAVKPCILDIYGYRKVMSKSVQKKNIREQLFIYTAQIFMTSPCSESALSY